MTKEVSAKLKEELRRIHDSGLNIYALINRTKRELKSVRAHIPDEVLLKLCDVYWCEKNQIRKAFPWFIKVLKMEWMAYNANATIAEHDQYKRDFGPRGGIEALDAILARVMGRVKNNKNVRDGRSEAESPSSKAQTPDVKSFSAKEGGCTEGTKVLPSQTGGNNVESKKQVYVEGQPTTAVKAAAISTSGPGI